MKPNVMCPMLNPVLKKSKRSKSFFACLPFFPLWLFHFLVTSYPIRPDQRGARGLILPNREHHLQAALSAARAAAVGDRIAGDSNIPTPEANRAHIEYEKLYPLKYAQPTSYLRFSSTVEDCIGCPYDMDEEDDAFLKSMNKNRNAPTQCSENQFEEVMNCFEETAQAKQPFAAVDSPPVLSYEEIESSMDDYLDENAKHFTKDIYEHWKTRRLEAGNKEIITSLKVTCIYVVAVRFC